MNDRMIVNIEEETEKDIIKNINSEYVSDDSKWDPLGFYKDKSKKDIANTLEHVQREHVKISNEAYRLKKYIKNIIQSIETESEIAETCYNNQQDKIMQATFIGQKIAFETILRKLEKIDLGDDNEK